MRILVADDEKGLRDSIAEYLSLDGFEVRTAENGLSAMRLMEDEVFDVLVTDLKMPGADGLEVLAHLRSIESDIPVIMISAFGEISDAVEAMKLGAEDYLVKPFETEELRLKVIRAGEKRMMRREIERLRSRGEQGLTLESNNTAMKKLIALAERAAPAPANVLITGESGTGKEVLARYIHSKSERAGGPFVPINVGSIPETLLESELFGHEKGAFTGADRMKTGMFEAANGGTLFLDEIGDMPQHLQVKLLRAIQERKIQRLGSIRLLSLDVRIIAATNRDLERDVKDGLFREDLFYRLNVMRMHLPPLRDRLEDLSLLSAGFLSMMNERMARSVSGITADAVEKLKSYDFPGNIRELENLIERAVILSDGGELTSSDFMLPGAGGQQGEIPAARTLREVERQAIINALARWEGKKTRAAEELGIDRKTLFNKIREYGLGD
ncbi:MAG: sigma-54-dependent Fis family transcriptional regulator [Spirochaetales bacterium]|nr:sigma-54-dependent Fis family transcriptional regulator [Spirochaetales bacterium]